MSKQVPNCLKVKTGNTARQYNIVSKIIQFKHENKIFITILTKFSFPKFDTTQTASKLAIQRTVVYIRHT